MAESHPHSENTRSDTPVVRDLISENGAACGIHDKPDIRFDTPDFDIGFISSKNIPCFVIIMINEGLDTDSSCFAIVGDLLMGDSDVIKVFQRLRRFPQG